MNLEWVQEEIKRRASLSMQIDSIIQRDFAGQKKLPRGTVHWRISRELGCTLNNFLARLIISRMGKAGFAPRTHRGTQYFIFNI